MNRLASWPAAMVIGGGFFGMYIAKWLAERSYAVTLVEREPALMQRASLVNQARVHNGCHYPRSVLTALRSRISFERFTAEFRSCIYDSFEQYYMVGRLLGKVTARQFQQFCHRIGAPCEPASRAISSLVNPEMIEAVYLTTEYAFDAGKLRDQMEQRLADAGIRPLLNTRATRVEGTGGSLSVSVSQGSESHVLHGFSHVFNCTYSGINAVNTGSAVDVIPLKHEMTELCLVEMPAELRHCGVTVMCGPFFSFMPFPMKGCHSFSHVRYTPHYSWADMTAGTHADGCGRARATGKSAWRAMQADAVRYMPVLSGVRHIDSLWEVKTVLPRSESDDSRPILFKPNHGIKGLHCIMGGKIDNVYDAVSALEQTGLLGQTSP